MNHTSNRITQGLLQAMAAANVPLEDALWFATRVRREGVKSASDAQRVRTIFASIVDRTCLV